MVSESDATSLAYVALVQSICSVCFYEVENLYFEVAHAKELFSKTNSKLLKGVEDLESLHKEKEGIFFSIGGYLNRVLGSC